MLWVLQEVSDVKKNEIMIKKSEGQQMIELEHLMVTVVGTWEGGQRSYGKTGRSLLQEATSCGPDWRLDIVYGDKIGLRREEEQSQEMEEQQMLCSWRLQICFRSKDDQACWHMD